MTVHIEVGKTATLEARFYADGVLADDNPVTIGITKADGSTLVAAGTATTSGGVGIRRYALAAQTEVNLLKVTWTGTSQTVVTWVEIVEALLFTLSELRALKIGDDQPFSSTATPLFTDAQLMEARAATLDEFEHFLGFSPIPRFAREILDGDGSGTMLLSNIKAHHPPLSITVNGAPQLVGNYTLKRSGVLRATSSYTASGSFTIGVGNVAVEYVHGEARVMGDGGNVAMLRAAMRLLPGFSSTARSVTTPDGVIYDLGDMAGQITRAGTTRRFGIPAIDSWLQEWSQRGLAVA